MSTAARSGLAGGASPLELSERQSSSGLRAERFVRQILLPEIGEAGQQRIEEASAAVAGEGLAGEVAALYAEAAGFGSVAPGAIDVSALAPEAICATAPAREVLAGARAALAEIRRAIAVDEAEHALAGARRP